MKTVALVPLRGGSKGIVDKNIKLIAGKPLCYWALSAAMNSKCIDEVYVSTDSKKIKNTVDSFDMNIHLLDRPSSFATDTASTESVILHFMSLVDFDNLITIQATSPLTESDHLDQAFEYFLTENFDSLLTAVRCKRFFWQDDGVAINYDSMLRPRRQDFLGTYMENGAFYITKIEILNTIQNRLGGNIGIYEMPDETSIEIDELENWEVISNILQKKHNVL